VLVGGVVYDQVHHEFHITVFEFGDKLVDVGEGAVGWVDVFVVADVVAHVDLGGFVDGGEPDDVDAEVAEVVEFRGDAFYIAPAGSVGG